MNIMIYTKLTRLAMRIAYDAHKDQVDLSGVPYVFHPFHIAEQMEDERTTVIALLHDVVEDSKYTFEDLEIFGFDDDILKPLRLLTRIPGEPYEKYIKRLCSDPAAVKVKLADLEHNLDDSRCEKQDEHILRLRERYEKAREYIKKGL